MDTTKPIRPSQFHLSLSLLLAVVLLSTSCDRVHLRRDVQRMMESTIVLPEEVSVALDVEVWPMPESLRDVPKMIVYIDSSECTMCRVSEFKNIYGFLYTQSQERGLFELVLLIRSGEINGMPIARVISDFEFGIPVYVDDRNSFLRDNPSIPVSDSRLHALFVDGKGKPVFIGDPGKNAKILKLLDDYLNQRERSTF